MRDNKISRADTCFNEAEQIFNNNMQWRRRPESHLEVAYVKAGLSLAKKSATRQEDVQEYISLFQRRPFLTHYHLLQELKKIYDKDVDASLFSSVSLYFNTMFRSLHIWPIMV
jgi:hypothetical protein